MAVTAAALGEFRNFHPWSVSREVWLALLYLIVAGSIVGFTAYVWLIHHESPTKVGTYAYVNPVVAVVLGWAVDRLGETRAMRVGAELIVQGVDFGLPRRDEVRKRIDAILDTIRLKPLRSRVAGSLSHGQKQWLEIGMLLAQDPKLLLVDEPVAGMTDVETHQTAELLKEINRDKTIMVVEHDMTFVRELGVKVTCLHEGSVLAEGTIDQVSSNERVIEVYLGR